MRRAVPLATVRHAAPRPGARRPTMLVLHGLFGAARNWRTPLMKLHELQPAVHMQALDLRNHGNSPHTDEMDFDVMALDVQEHIEREALREPRPVLLGHSLGGRVAMQVALKRPDLLSGLVVVDVAPRPPPPSSHPPIHLRLVDTMAAMRTPLPAPSDVAAHSLRTVRSVWARLRYLCHLRSPSSALAEVRSRRDAEAFMEARVPDAVTRAFLLSNLVDNADAAAGPDAPRFRWRLNIPALRRFIPRLLHMEFAADTPPAPASLPTLFLVGGRSDYVLPADHARITQLFPSARIDTVPGAGHWLHSEQPAAFSELVSRWLDDTKPFS